MSHTLRKVNLGNSAFVIATIVDYAQGGEAFTLAELGITGGVTGVFILDQLVLPTGIPVLVPQFASPNLIKLMGGAGMEQPSTVGINYTFIAIVQGT